MSQPDQLTLRGFDPRLRRAIEELARRERLSLNKAALRLMERGAGLDTRESADRIGHSLDHFIGTWTEADADELLESIQSSEQVDKDLWE